MRWIGSLMIVVSVATAASTTMTPLAVAQRADRIEDRTDHREDRRDQAVDLGPLDRLEDRVDERENRVDRRTGPHAPAVRWTTPAPLRVVEMPHALPPRALPVAPRLRVVAGVRIYRPFGPTILGYGFRYADEDALPWIAFTAISLKLLDGLAELEVRKHEQAQIDATTASIGETIYWEGEQGSGSVAAIREGRNASGETCREFYQTITAEGLVEDAYNVACLGKDGRWRIAG